MKRIFVVSMLVMLVGLCLAPTAEAHKVTIFAWAEGNRVYTESKFSGGKVVKNGKVEVFDKNGALLIEGRTDDNGEFSFKAPVIADLKIVLTAGMGHKNAWTLTAAELGGGDEQPVASVAPAPEPPQALPLPARTSGLTAEAVEAIVARQLEEKIQPLTRMVAASQDKGPSLSDIIGGIGYIIGLVGVGAYIRYRRNGREP